MLKVTCKLQITIPKALVDKVGSSTRMLAYAGHFGLPTLFSEDFQSGRIYDGVRIVNPFATSG